MPEPVGTALIVAVACVAAWSDVRTRRIPNALTVTALAAALALSLAGGGVAQMLGALGAAGVVLLLGIPLFALGLLGGGDVKLMIAFGAALGMERLLPALLLTAVAGGMLALVEAVRQGVLVQVLANCRTLVVGWFAPVAVAPVTGHTTLTLPYGVAIGVGAVLAWLL